MNIKFTFLFPVATRSSSFAVSADIASATQGYAKASVEASKIIESALATDTDSGDIASFSDGADGLNVKSLVLGIEPVQSGSGDPSPSNVRPISGHTDVVVTRTGKNVLPENASFPTTTKGVTFTKNANGAISFTGTTSSNDFSVDVGSVLLNAGTYILSGAPSNTKRLRIAKGSTLLGHDTGSGYSFTLTESATVFVTFRITDGSGVAVSGTVSPMIRISTDDATYEPYQSDTLSLSLPSAAGTVYGGTLDVTTGKLTVDRAIVDIGSLSWSVYGSGAHARFGTTGIQSTALAPASDSTQSPILCEALKPDTATRIYNQTAASTIGIGANGTLYAYAPNYSTAADFKTAMNGVELVYPLATPIEYTLSPAQLATLKGSNNIWQDSGTVAVEYFCDTKLYINKVLAALA